MKHRFLITVSGAVLATALQTSAWGATNLWPFFAFDNGVGRGVWPAEQQAATLQELGYDGIHYNYTNNKDLVERLRACREHHVKLVAIYFYTYIGKAEPYDPNLKEAIRLLKGTDVVLWTTLRDGKPGQSDADAVKIVQDLADQAQASGIRVSLYPHAGFYVATAEDAVRVVKQVHRDNVGVTVNLCHELFAGNGNRMAEVLKTAKPYMTLASINGAEAIPGKKGSAAWDTLALGDGSYDVLGFLKLLRDSGYRGPVGHQFYAVKGDDREKLTKAIKTWKSYQPKLAEP